MKIREAEFSKCKCCGKRGDLISDEAYGCDSCGKVIDMNKKGDDYISATLYHKKYEPAEDFVFCSWKCALKKLSKVKTDYFISLPFLTFDSRKKGVRAKDFWEAVRFFK